MKKKKKKSNIFTSQAMEAQMEEGTLLGIFMVPNKAKNME